MIEQEKNSSGQYGGTTDTSGKWLENIGKDSDVIMSSRIRLARGLYKMPFPHWAQKSELLQVIEQVFDAARKVPELKDSFFIRLEELQPIDRELLVERHLISPDILKNPDTAAVIIDKQERISIMINEEDHIRIQVFSEGLSLGELYSLAERIDDGLESYLDYGFSSVWGYDTACITNVGTGMRVSCLFHLPALVLSKKINQLIKAVGQFGLTVRGLYGEGTEALGYFFQISNQITLGLSEQELIEKVQNIAEQVGNYERQERENLLKTDKVGLEDLVWRSYGVLKYAHRISTAEAYERLSHLKLGIDLGLINDVAPEKVRRLLIISQKNHVQKLSGTEISDNNVRDQRRAELIREVLEGQK